MKLKRTNAQKLARRSMTYKQVIIDEMKYLKAKKLELEALIEVELHAHKVVRRFIGAKRRIQQHNDELIQLQRSLSDIVLEEIQHSRPV